MTRSSPKKPRPAEAAATSKKATKVPPKATQYGHREQRDQDLRLLGERFAVFREGKPLAIGIHKSLREAVPEFDVNRIRAVLGNHVRSTRYLKAVSQGGARFDLTGAVAGEVTEEQRAQAATELKARYRVVAERRRAEQEAKERQEKLLLLAKKFSRE